MRPRYRIDKVMLMISARVGTAFIPVTDPETAARWYSQVLGLRVRSADRWSAVLDPGADTDATTAGSATALTLLGPASGIQAKPGLPWATCNFAVTDLERARADVAGHGCDPSAIDGAPEVCLYFSFHDPDGNTLLITDR